MSQLKVRLIVALVAAATVTSASTAQAQANKKKSFAELLNGGSFSTTTASTPSVTSGFGSSGISAQGFTNARAASQQTGIRADTARGNLTLAQYRRLVYRQLLQNRNNLFASLRLYQQELRSGQITRAQFNASRLNALTIFTGYSAAFQSEFTSGTPYYFTFKIGVGPNAITPGPARVSPVTPVVTPPITGIR